jgi:hypothetical protein
VALTYNLSYLGGCNPEDRESRLDQAKKLHETSCQQNKKVDEVAHACHPSYGRKHKIGGPQPGQPEQKVRLYLQNNHRKRARGLAE